MNFECPEVPADHDRRDQPALGRTPTLTLPLHRPLRQGLPRDGPLPLPQDAPLALPQAPGVPGPAGEGSGRTEPPAGPQEEEGTGERT